MNVCLGRGGEAWVGFRSLRWPTCAVVGCCGPSWACVGRRRALWDLVGLRLASVGCCGPAVVFGGRGGVLWALVGLRWSSLAVVGCCGPSWACVGLPWAAVDLR